MNDNTQIPSPYPLNSLLTIGGTSRSEDVFIQLGENATCRSTTVRLSDLATALAAHFPIKVVPVDAIVIERSELPSVHACDDGPDRVHIGGHDKETWIDEQDTPQAIRAVALRNLALAEYLEAHPLVDEAQVEALAELLWEHAGNPSGPGDRWHEIPVTDRARFLNRSRRVLATGRVHIDVLKEQP